MRSTYNYNFEKDGKIMHIELHTHTMCIALVLNGNGSNQLSSQCSYVNKVRKINGYNKEGEREKKKKKKPFNKFG